MSEPRKKRGNSLRGRNNNENNNGQTTRGTHSTNRSKMNSKFHRQTSYDHVRKIVQKEGREARNLITWNVPVDDDQQERRRGPAAVSASAAPPPAIREDTQGHRVSHPRKANRSHSASAPRTRQPSDTDAAPKSARPKDLPGVRVGFDGGGGGLRLSRTVDSPNQLSSSQNSTSGATPKKSDLRARYWAFLFENLRRAVDEIYQTCETDESVVECKEVLMMLEQCTKDFKSLIERLQLLKAFEDADEGNKPTSLAWEVRKSSPGKGLGASERGKDFVPSPTVVRSLNFNLPPQNQKPPPGNSWADRVKGIVPKAPVAPPREQTQTDPTSPAANSQDGSTSQSTVQKSPPEVDTSQTENLDDDTEGWETVHRNSRAKRPLSAGNKNNNIRELQNMQNKIANSQYQRSISIDPSVITKAKDGLIETRPIKAETANQNLNMSPNRKRTSSLDSEKENQPIRGTDESPLSDKSNNNRTEDFQDPSILVKGPSLSGDRPHGEPTENGGVNKEREEARQAADDELKDELLGSMPDITDDEEEEAQFNSALASALDEEDHLSCELEKVQQAALESAIQEEESYLKEIAREESMEVEVETETETESELGNTASTTTLESSLSLPLDWDSMVKQYEADAEYRQNTSWGDMVDDTETRTPGRVVHMHEKLSSPSRKRSPTESRKRYEEKQAKAQELREKLQQERSERLLVLNNKVEEVQAWKEELLLQRRDTMERKLQRAEEKRSLQLKQKVRKAHEEENKANEIAFINTLEAQNKRHDIFTKYQESEARLQDIQEERQRRHVEKLAKEAAVEERRRALQAERQARLQEIQERRKHRVEVIEQRQQEKEKERHEAARAKERDREERMAALNAQQQAHIEELQKKIQLKQEESGRRHKEQLGHIMEKAFSMSILRHSTEDHNEAPKLAPYEKQKFCKACGVMIPSEVHLSSHLRGKKHQQALKDSTGGSTELSKAEIEQFNLDHIADAPLDKTNPKAASERERQKSLKKRCKKLRQRMSQRGTEYEASLSGKQQSLESEHKAKLQKVSKDLTKYLQGHHKGPWPQSMVSALDRGLGEICRILEKKAYADQNTFRVAGGLTTLSRILLVIGDSTATMPPVIPQRSLMLCCTVFRMACKGCYDNCHYMLFSNKAGTLVDLLNHKLNLLIPDNFSVNLSSSGGATSLRLPHDPIATSLMQLIATVLSVLAKHNPAVNSSEASAERMSTSGDAFMSRAGDIVSYVISIGILDKLSQYFNNVRGPIDTQPLAAEFLQHGMGLLIAMSRIISKRNVNIFGSRKKDDSTQLISTFQVTGLVGIVSLMYGMLLHSGAPARGEAPPPELPAHSLSVATVGFRMLNQLAMLDLQLLQGSLGEEGTSLEFRHIASYLLWYCSNWTHEELLHEVILCVGYFTVLHPDNQVIIQSGQAPTVLQQMCALPFQYFSDPKLTGVLFPTLITCCYSNPRNRQILEQELSCALLANFVEEKLLETQTKQSPTMTKKSKANEKEPDLRMALGSRFPPEEWSEAQTYFKSSK